MRKVEEKGDANIGGVNVEYIIRQSQQLINSEPVPKEEYRYRKGIVKNQQPGPLVLRLFPYIKFKNKK